ncbi:MAG: hypothetical protein ACJARI_001098, partial [Bacteroidia bacterium]
CIVRNSPGNEERKYMAEIKKVMGI